MQTRLIAVEVSLRAPSDQLRAVVKGSDALRSDVLKAHIEAELSTYGMPLRWAITSVNKAEQTAHVEAVVTRLNEGYGD